MISINLLDDRRKEILAKQARLAKFVAVSVSVLVVVVIISASSFGYRLYEKNRLDQVEKQKSKLTTQINEYVDVFNSLELVKKRVVSIEDILSNRELARKKIDVFFSIYTSNLVNINDVGFGGTAKPLDLEISGTVDNIGEFIKLNDYFRDLGETESLDYVLLQNLNRTEVGGYRVSYLIRFVKIEA